jgi:hypothetical protein
MVDSMINKYPRKYHPPSVTMGSPKGRVRMGNFVVSHFGNKKQHIETSGKVRTIRILTLPRATAILGKMCSILTKKYE